MMSATPTLESMNEYTKMQQNQSAGNRCVIRAIKQASARTGVDFAYLLNKADQESSLNPNAQASTSSASGLFQFIKSTWLKMVKDHGAEYGLSKEASAITEKNGKLQVDDQELRQSILNLRHDPVLSSAMAAEFTKENKDYLDASVGGTIGSTELYMAHFLGAGGASTFLKNMRATPDRAAADVLPDAAAANTSVFYSKTGRALSLQEIYHRFAAKFDSQPDRAVATVTPPALTRDWATLSSSFYHDPDQKKLLDSNPFNVDMNVLQQVLKQNNSTSDTLFNTMLFAQVHMNDTLMGVASAKTARQDS